MPEVQARRVYQAPMPSDGARVLVDRLWPRGLAKDAARLDEWLKAVAPSGELRRWYGHEPARFAEFRRRYTAELADPERAGALAHLRELASAGPVTLLTAARDLARSQAAVLAQLLAGEPEAERGGDPACWLNLVCPRCGTMAEHGRAARCPRCGAAIPAG